MLLGSKLKRGLKKALVPGADLFTELDHLSDEEVKSASEAELVVQVLRRLPLPAGEETTVLSPLSTIVGWFQSAENEKAIAVFKQFGTQELLRVFDDYLIQASATKEWPHATDVIYLLKIICFYRPEGGHRRVVAAARHPKLSDEYLWNVIFEILGREEHTWGTALLEELRHPLPVDFAGVAFLDFANTLSREGRSSAHPFDSEEGLVRLTQWLTDQNDEHYSYAHSAAAAIPFVCVSTRSKLLDAAFQHTDPDVRLEAAWAAAKCGLSLGLDILQKACADPNTAEAAERYLLELGAEERIPLTSRRPDFRATAAMCAWLSHPQEFDRPPDKIELRDTRILFWPPTEDERRVWVFRFTYHATESEEETIGQGMVGSITFALFGEATEKLSPEAVYALHCCWELEVNEDPQAPENRSVEAGLSILRQANSGF